MLIYRITNRLDGKVYIGKWMRSNPKERWTEHLRLTREGSASHFHNAIRKYGPEVFSIETLYRAKTPKELAKMETFFIILHQSQEPENGYNMTLGGDGAAVGSSNPWYGTHGPMGGRKHTETAKGMIAASLRGVRKTEEHIENLRQARRLWWQKKKAQDPEFAKRQSQPMVRARQGAV